MGGGIRVATHRAKLKVYKPKMQVSMKKNTIPVSGVDGELSVKEFVVVSPPA